jgi:hypothetical protein
VKRGLGDVKHLLGAERTTRQQVRIHIDQLWQLIIALLPCWHGSASVAASTLLL